MKETKSKKEKYKFSTMSGEFVMTPGTISMYLGQPVMLIKFTKIQDKEWGTPETMTVTINSVTEYDPIMFTCLVRYTTMQGEIKEERINPIGFTAGNPEELSELLRFVPFSTHYKMVEKTGLSKKLKGLWEKNDTIPTLALQQLASSKNQADVLNSRCVMAVYVDGEGAISFFRITRLSLAHVVKDKYTLHLVSDLGDSFIYNIKTGETVLAQDEELGGLKLIDLKTR